MIDWMDYEVALSQRGQAAQGQATDATSEPATATNGTDDTVAFTGAQQPLSEAATDERAAPPPPSSSPTPAPAPALATAPKTRKRKATEAVAPRQKIPRAAKGRNVNYRT